MYKCAALRRRLLLNYCMCVWGWIAATVQAMRLRLEMKLNGGGTVAAISLSTMHMRSAASPVVMLIIVQHLGFGLFAIVFRQNCPNPPQVAHHSPPQYSSQPDDVSV